MVRRAPTHGHNLTMVVAPGYTPSTMLQTARLQQGTPNDK